MYDEPSSAAWVLLATLCGTIVTLGWLTTWARKRADDEPRVLEEGDRRGIRSVAQRAMAAAAVVALVPALIAALQGAPWQPIVWWAVLAAPVTVVVPLVLGSGAGFVWIWVKTGGYIEPEATSAA